MDLEHTIHDSDKLDKPVVVLRILFCMGRANMSLVDGSHLQAILPSEGDKISPSLCKRLSDDPESCKFALVSVNTFW